MDAVRVALGVGVGVGFGVGFGAGEPADADADGRGDGRPVRRAAAVACGAVIVPTCAGDPALVPPDPEPHAPVACRAVAAIEARGEEV
jgi:hypothetical protein